MFVAAVVAVAFLSYDAWIDHFRRGCADAAAEIGIVVGGWEPCTAPGRPDAADTPTGVPGRAPTTPSPSASPSTSPSVSPSASPTPLPTLSPTLDPYRLAADAALRAFETFVAGLSEAAVAASCFANAGLSVA